MSKSVQEWKRDRPEHTQVSLSVFILIRQDSCGHLDSAYVFRGFPKPAPFIIFQQSSSNWAASPPAVTHHLLHIEQEEIQMYLLWHSPVAAHKLLHLNYIRGQLSTGTDTELIPSATLPFFSPVDACLLPYPQWCRSLVMMWPVCFPGDKATTLHKGLEAL